jgi:hypothetical protein
MVMRAAALVMGTTARSDYYGAIAWCALPRFSLWWEEKVGKNVLRHLSFVGELTILASLPYSLSDSSNPRIRPAAAADSGKTTSSPDCVATGCPAFLWSQINGLG